jgi:hypothetical protein
MTTRVGAAKAAAAVLDHPIPEKKPFLHIPETVSQERSHLVEQQMAAK